MPLDLKGADWKMFKEVHEIALKRFCERVVAEVHQMSANTNRDPHEQYVSILEFMKARSKDVERVFDDYRRSTAVVVLANMKEEGLLEPAELAKFSPETLQSIAGIEEIRGLTPSPRCDR